MQLSTILTEEHIVLGLNAKTARELFNAMLAPLSGRFDTGSLLDALLEREQLGSTGVGWGVAVPHVRLDGLDAPVVVFARLEKPIDFAAIDNEPCDLFFMVLAPKARDQQDKYLQIMARISRLMRDQEIHAALKQAPTPAAVLELIRSQEG